MDENFGSWSVLTTNFLMTLYIALGGVTLASVLHLINAQWRFQVRYIAVATAALFPLAGVLLIILLLNGESTFVWLATADDPNNHLPGWHNYTFLVFREIGGFIGVAALYLMFIKYQHLASVDDKYKRKFRNIALLIPFAYFLYGSMIAWDFEMTMYPGWHSANYGAYQFVSGFQMFLAFFTVLLYFLGRSGVLVKELPIYISNFLAQFMLAMTILWTYLYFTQYLIMWYGRLPSNMDRFDAMMHNDLSVIWWTFLACKFVIPFLTFVITPNRHNPTTVMVIACFIILGTWLERYTWISGSGDPAFYHMPMTSLFDILVTAIVIAAGYFSMKKVLLHYGIIRTKQEAIEKKSAEQSA